MPILLFLKLFGKYGKTLDKSAAFEKNFNAILGQMICGYLDEVDIDTDHQLMSMKNIITGETKGIRAMRQDRVIEPNYSRLFLTSNNEHKQNLMTADNRRFFALETARTMLDDVHGKKSIRKWGKQFSSIKLEYLAAKLWQVDLNGFEPSNFPDTPLMKRWQQKSLDGAQRFWMACIEIGQIGHDDFWMEFDNSHKPESRLNMFGVAVNKKGIYESYLYWTKSFDGKPLSDNTFWAKTKALFDSHGCYFTSKPSVGGIRVDKIQIGGTIEQLKSAFEKSVGFVGIFDRHHPRQVVSDPAQIILDIRRFPVDLGIDPETLHHSVSIQLTAVNTDQHSFFRVSDPSGIPILEPYFKWRAQMDLTKWI